jgi:phosphatidylinositol-3-phosphatase
MGLASRTARVAVGVGAVVVALAVAGAGLPWGDVGAAQKLPAAASVRLPQPPRVAVMVLENRSYSQVIGSPNAPYLNRLAGKNALATRYYAVAHPSLPNYIALTGGSTFDFKRNCASCSTSERNLVQQLSEAGVSWKAYFEGLTSSHRPGAVTSRYNPHYNPFVYYEGVRGTAAHRSRILGFRGLRRDLAGGTLPRFSWIAPSVRHDGHDGSLRQADRYASQLVPRVLRALGPNGVLYLTWDEGTDRDQAGLGGSNGGGHVALIAAGGAARHRATTTAPANHYALLRTIEASFGLRALGKAGSPSTPLLSGLLRPVSHGRRDRDEQRRPASGGTGYPDRFAPAEYAARFP